MSVRIKEEVAAASNPDDDIELYVTGVPHSWNRDQFQQLFEPLGAVSMAHLPHTFVGRQDGALRSFLFSCSHADCYHSFLFFLALSNCCYADGCCSIAAQHMTTQHHHDHIVCLLLC